MDDRERESLDSDRDAIRDGDLECAGDLAAPAREPSVDWIESISDALAPPSHSLVRIDIAMKDSVSASRVAN